MGFFNNIVLVIIRLAKYLAINENFYEVIIIGSGLFCFCLLRFGFTEAKV